MLDQDSKGLTSTADTWEAFADPQEGDTFQEMFWFWIVVIRVDGQNITVMEGNPPCELPRDGKVIDFTSRFEFREKYQYGVESLGYWVRLHKRAQPVEGWYELTKERIRGVTPGRSDGGRTGQRGAS